MFKVISAEIKKMLSKPGIYILSVLLAVVLILGVFIYKPTIHESKRFELNGVTFVEKYTDFNKGDNAGKKAEYQTKLENSINSIENYTILVDSRTISQEQYINELLAKYEEIYNAYFDCIAGSTNNYINSTRTNLVSSLESLNSAIENALINSQQGSFTLLTTKTNYEAYKTAYSNVLSWAQIAVEQENLTEHFVSYRNNYEEPFYNAIKNFKYPHLSQSFIKDYTSTESGTKYSVLNERLNSILQEIENYYNLARTDVTINNKQMNVMDDLANKYAATIDAYSNLIKYELISNAFSIVSTSEELKMLHLSDYSSFNSNSLLKKYDYLFKHNKTEFDYARPLTIGVTSNDKINAYDYSYFVLKIFSFIIIVYSILAACHSIAGEIKEGSMRYLSIRPISRTNMFFGKWLSIILISVILMLFSAVISLCVGWAVYGINSNKILTIFNGSIAFTIHPIGMVLLFLLSMLFELIIYSLIAMLLSILFKSDLMSMTILIVLYLLNTMLPIFVQGSNTWLAFYPFSHISIYSLFGSSIYAVPNNFFNLVFGAKTYAGSHAALTISIITLLSLLLCIISIKLFKKKEL